MRELFSYGFMQRAFVASAVMGVVCSIMGVFVVLRGLTFIGAGTAHAAFAGITFGFLVGAPPFAMAVLFSLATVWITALLSNNASMKPDVSIGIFYTLTMALAILFLGLMRSYRPEVLGYLFGSILSVTASDLTRILIASCVILLCLALFFKEFHFISFDQEMAEASGIPARWLFRLLLNLIALSIVIAIPAVGALLVFALLVIPAAAAQQWASHLRSMIFLSAALGVLACWAGVILSYLFDLPSGTMIVLSLTAIFVLSIVFSPKRRA